MRAAQPRYLTVAEAAAMLGVSLDTVRRRIASGELPATRIGARVWAIPADGIDQLRGQPKHKPGPKPRRRQEQP